MEQSKGKKTWSQSADYDMNILYENACFEDELCPGLRSIEK